MVPFLFAIASLIILTPIVLLFPIGFTKKWKIVLIGSAFLLGNLGMIASIQFPFYQTILILVLLIGLLSLLLEKRIGNPSLTETDSKFIVHKNFPLEKENIHKVEEEKPRVAIEFDPPKAALVNEVAVTTELAKEKENDNNMELEYFHNVKKELDDEIRLNKQRMNEPEIIDNSLDIDEDVSFLTNRAINFSEIDPSLSIIEQEKNNSEPSYMSEIEKLIEEEDNQEEHHTMNNRTADFQQQAEMEELEEIEFPKVIPTAEKSNIEKEFIDEIEIEELVFDK